MVLSNISYRYSANGEPVLKDINLSLDSTGLVCLFGKSGSGKSTLLSLMAGFLEPSEGQVLKKPEERTVTVFQDAELIDGLTVEENAELWLTLKGVEPAQRHEASLPVLKRVGLAELKNRKVIDLSGGERQRVALALAALADKSIILADEPTGALDEANALTVMEFLKELSATRPVVCATHNQELAKKYADRIWVIENGRVKEVKSPNHSRVPLIDGGAPGKLRFKDSFRLNFGLLGRRKGRIALSSLASGFSFAALAFALSLALGADDFAMKMADGYYAPDVYTLSLQAEISQDLGMTLKRQSELNQHLVSSLEEETGGRCYPSLSYFLPSSFETKIGTTRAQASLAPSFEGSRVDYGREPLSSKDLVVNSSLCQAFKIKPEEIIGRAFSLETSCELAVRIADETEYVPFAKKWRFEIVGVVAENLEFNTPVAYYSYPELYSALSQEELNTDYSLTIGDLFEKRWYDGSDVRGYETLVQATDETKLTRWLNKHPEIDCVSRPQLAREAASEIATAVSQLSLIFLAVTAVISFFIEFYSVSTILVESRPQYAFLRSLCVSRKSFLNSTRDSADIFLLISSLAYVVSLVIIGAILPYGLTAIGLPKDLCTPSLLAIVLMFLLMGIVTIMATYLPLSSMSRKGLLQSMRSER